MGSGSTGADRSCVSLQGWPVVGLGMPSKDQQSPKPPEPEPEKPGSMVRPTPPLTAEERARVPHVEVRVPKRRKYR